MLRGSFSLSVMFAVLVGCSGGDGGIGDSCSDNSDCSNSEQCLNRLCVARCQRGPDCGDGYSCDDHGLCHLSTLDKGALCTSETECAPGLSCQFSTSEPGEALESRCQLSQGTISRPAGSECDRDSDCRNGTCALGHCVDHCDHTIDCAATETCAQLPRITAEPNEGPIDHGMFKGCVQSTGFLAWTIPTAKPNQTILLPIPDNARAMSVSLTVADSNQMVGVDKLVSPDGAMLYTRPCSVDTCTTNSDFLDQYFSATNLVRHQPQFGQSVLAMPSGKQDLPEPGTYQMTVGSFRADGGPGTAIPRVTAVIKLDDGKSLDLHFHFLDLSDHPCNAAMGGPLSAATAKLSTSFQNDFVEQLRSIFSNLTIKTPTYENVAGHETQMSPEPDALDDLLALGAYKTGVNIYFVRSISPSGVQAFGPNPGPAGLAGTAQSGIAIGIDTMCYRDWKSLARLTAHELARYMGLYHNTELGTPEHPSWHDPLGTDASINNLMYFSASGGANLTDAQRAILNRSPVLH